jgi:hypothetical protein
MPVSGLLCSGQGVSAAERIDRRFCEYPKHLSEQDRNIPQEISRLENCRKKRI